MSKNAAMAPPQPSSELLPPDPHIISGAELMRMRDRIEELEAALRDGLAELSACAAQLSAREGGSVFRARERMRDALSGSRDLARAEVKP